MKKAILVLGILIVTFIGLSFMQYSQIDFQRTAQIVLGDGILLPNLETSSVFYDEFYDLDTTNDYDTFEAAGPGAIAISTEGYWRFSSALKCGGGILKMAWVSVNAPTADSLTNIQKKGSVVYIGPSGKQIEFAGSIMPNDTIKIGWSIGLTPPDADSIVGVARPRDGIYFSKPYGDSLLYFITVKDSTHTSRVMVASMSAIDTTIRSGIICLNDTSWIDLKFEVLDTNLVIPYVNGKLDSSITTNIPHNMILVPFLEMSGDTIALRNWSAKQLD